MWERKNLNPTLLFVSMPFHLYGHYYPCTNYVLIQIIGTFPGRERFGKPLDRWFTWRDMFDSCAYHQPINPPNPSTHQPLGVQKGYEGGINSEILRKKISIYFDLLEVFKR